MSPFGASGTYTSKVLDAGVAVNLGAITWDAEVPTGTTMVVAVRTGNVATPDATWSAFTTVAASGGVPALSGRYLQYRVQFTSTGSRVSTARLNAINLAYSAKAL